ncbi:hypothetical protein ABIA65_003665 [Mycolicibacterium sp. 624]
MTDIGFSVGLLIPEVMPAHDAVELGVSLEAAGFDAAWSTEIDREPIVRCAAVIEAFAS